MPLDLPYFDMLLEGRRRGDQAAQAFERFVHWGYWEGKAEGTDADFLAAMERLNEQVLAAGDLKDGQSILDAGCGFGGTLSVLASRFPKARLVGVNIDPRQLANRVPSRAQFARADACKLPVADGSLDRVLAVECIFHFPSRASFLKEAARALKPGGLFALSDFVPWHGGRKGGGVGFIERQVGRGYGSQGRGWSEGSYAEMARAAGLEIVVDRDITRQTLPTYPILMRLLKSGAMAGQKSRMLWPTRLLWLGSWLGAVRYRVVAFRKPA